MPTRVTRTSYLSGITRTLELKAYEPDDFERRWLAYKRGNMTLDEAFELASPEAREFIRSGATESEWRQYVLEGNKVGDRGYNNR